MITAAADAAVIGLAVTYVWALAAFLHTPIIRPIQRWLRRSWRWPLISCPWCFGFWAAMALTILVHASTGRLGWSTTPVVVLASASLVGIIGSNWAPSPDPEETP